MIDGQTPFDFNVETTIDVDWKHKVGDKVVMIDAAGFPSGSGKVTARFVRLEDNVPVEISFLVKNKDGDIVSVDINQLRTENDLKCCNCNRYLDDLVDDVHYVGDGPMCWGCYEATFETASNVYMVTDGVVEHLLVTDYEAINDYGDEVLNGPKISRTWRSSSGWRGYNETSIEGWVEVPGLNGWTTGFVDETVARKADLNTWVQRVLDGGLDEGEECPVPLAIILDPTSNVFSTAVGVWAQENDVEAVKQWMADDYDMLSEALG